MATILDCNCLSEVWDLKLWLVHWGGYCVTASSALHSVLVVENYIMEAAYIKKDFINTECPFRLWGGVPTRSLTKFKIGTLAGHLDGNALFTFFPSHTQGVNFGEGRGGGGLVYLLRAIVYNWFHVDRKSKVLIYTFQWIAACFQNKRRQRWGPWRIVVDATLLQVALCVGGLWEF